MWIFFKHLPRGTTTREINKVTLKGCKTSFGLTSMFKRNIVKRCKIIRIRDLKQDRTEYHGLVQVDSPTRAENIIENLDGKTVNGLFLKPHRYQRRFPSRDRRMGPAVKPQKRERRMADRRRANLVTHVLEFT
jgi:hypothetical protein